MKEEMPHWCAGINAVGKAAKVNATLVKLLGKHNQVAHTPAFLTQQKNFPSVQCPPALHQIWRDKLQNLA